MWVNIGSVNALLPDGILSRVVSQKVLKLLSWIMSLNYIFFKLGMQVQRANELMTLVSYEKTSLLIEILTKIIH